MFSVPVSTEPSFRAGTPRELFDGPDAAATYLDVISYDVAPDGTRFLMIRRDPPPEPDPIHVVLNWIEEVKAAFE